MDNMESQDMYELIIQDSNSPISRDGLFEFLKSNMDALVPHYIIEQLKEKKEEKEEKEEKEGSSKSVDATAETNALSRNHCRKCGRLVSHGSNFCIYCGADIQDSKTLSVPRTNTLDIIDSMCVQFVKAHPGKEFYVSDKLSTFFLERFESLKNERILLGHDNTLFKSGKNGFLITRTGIYNIETTGSKTKTTFEKLEQAQKVGFVNSKGIVADSKCIACFSGNKMIGYELAQLFESIRKVLSRRQKIQPNYQKLFNS